MSGAEQIHCGGNNDALVYLPTSTAPFGRHPIDYRSDRNDRLLEHGCEAVQRSEASELHLG